jgi:hypothetical protein
VLIQYWGVRLSRILLLYCIEQSLWDVEADFLLPALRVIHSMEPIIEWRGKPAAFRSDNGREYISAELVAWANRNRITLIYIQPGKRTQNAYIVRCNQTARHEWLDRRLFESMEQAKSLAAKWPWQYKNERLNTAIEEGLQGDYCYQLNPLLKRLVSYRRVTTTTRIKKATPVKRWLFFILLAGLLSRVHYAI